jgi:beta-glucanase (GH16 family)
MKKLKALSVIAALALLTGCGSGSSSSSKPAADTTTKAVTTAASTVKKATKPTIEEVNYDYKIDPSSPEISSYNLLWSDEFSGNSLDEEIWNRELRQPGWTNSELQEYTESEENAFIRNGKLVIKAIKSEKDGADYYTSAKIQCQNKADFTYGKIVVSAKVPEGKGLWPAIWMMPKSESFYGQWPRCGEIDIMEVLGNDVKKAYGTIHYGDPHAEQQGTFTLDNGSFASDFHEYSVEWEPGEIRWYIDDQLYLTVTDWFSAPEGGVDKPFPAPFNQPFYIQLNLAVGGSWPGNPDETTDFDNAEFEVDYVRVYQKPIYYTAVTKPEKVFREPTEDGNLVYNGDFSVQESLTDEQNWKFMLFEGGEATAEIKNNSIVISTTKEGSVDYSVQLVQPDLPIRKGKKYRVSFDARADEERDMIVCISAPTAGWVRYLKDTTVTVPTETTSFSYDFMMINNDDNNGRLEFNLGNKGSTATVYISNVRIEAIE